MRIDYIYFKATGISRKLLTANIREELFSLFKQIIAYQMHKDGIQLKNIAKYLKYADHTTPSYAVKKIKFLVSRNDAVTIKVLELYQFRLNILKSKRRTNED